MERMRLPADAEAVKDGMVAIGWTERNERDSKIERRRGSQGWRQDHLMGSIPGNEGQD